MRTRECVCLKCINLTIPMKFVLNSNEICFYSKKLYSNTIIRTQTFKERKEVSTLPHGNN